jgi:hypothetical protein
MALRRRTAAFLLIAASTVVFLAGCGTLPNGRGWGQDALWPVDAGRVVRAARDALLDPGTLVPLAGAAVFAIDDFDERVSDWAAERHPVFGSMHGADDASTWIRNALEIEAFATPLATPSGDTLKQWLPAKLRGYGVEVGASEVVGQTTTLLKDQIERTRPDHSDVDSFPSGHAVRAFSYMTLSNRNLQSVEAMEDVRPVLKTVNVVAAAGVGWARVEAGRHYPSDVLVGAALGHFLTAFLHDAFMNLPEDGSVDYAVFPIDGGAGIGLALRF